MADVLTVVGNLVACEERAYGSFTDRETGEVRPGGVTWWAYVAPSFDLAPVAVKVRGNQAKEWSDLLEAGQGSGVAIVCELRAQGDRITRTLISAEVTDTADAAAAAAGRRREPLTAK